MGATSEQFIEDREAQFLSFAEELRYVENFDTVSEVKQGLNAMPKLIDFEIEEFENGDISSLELALKFRTNIENLKTQIDKMEDWIKENKRSITSESEKYPEGYHGYKVALITRETMCFKNIPQWINLEKAKKDFEAKSKLALKLVQKGGINVDEDGQEIPLPEITASSYVKFDKLK